MRFVFFTKTEWNEPPRIRHQLAHLLIEQGHEVQFFQKCRLNSKAECSRVKVGLTLCRHPHLLHHQLKFISPLRRLDRAFITRQIRSLVDLNECDVVVNFNYDFDFLSEIFDATPILHVVNDDFVAGAIRPNRKSAECLQAMTAADAKHTLCVSYSILEKIRKSTQNCSLFLPWARHKYRKPPRSTVRDEVLYWGYINDRLDFRAIDGILNADIKINFFGSITPSVRVRRMLEHSNAVYHGIENLQNRPDILARCCCTILPYDVSGKMAQAVTMSNRGFELLSFGLPLLYTKLPYLINAPKSVIYHCSSADEFILARQNAMRYFDESQSDIVAFLKDHYAENRYRQFMETVESTIVESDDFALTST